MSSPRKTPGIVICFLLCVLTLSLECLGSTDTVKDWEEDKTTQPNFTARSQRAWEPHRKQTRTTYNYALLDDRGTFFLIFGIGGVIVIMLLVCFFQKKRSTSSTPQSFSGATVHPPPNNWMRTTIVGSVQNPQPLSYDNTGFTGSNYNVNQLRASEVDSNPADRPPAYATLVLSDLGSDPGRAIYPQVRKTEETPPPVYTNGRPELN